MSSPLICVGEDDDIADVVKLLEKRQIKRVAVVRGQKVIGVVSRSNLLRAFVSGARRQAARPAGDEAIREAVLQAIERAGLTVPLVNVIASSGTVHLWGLVEGKAQREALVVCAEEVVGRERVENHVAIMAPLVRATFGAA